MTLKNFNSALQNDNVDVKKDDYTVRCDEVNNTLENIDQHQLRVDVEINSVDEGMYFDFEDDDDDSCGDIGGDDCEDDDSCGDDGDSCGDDEDYDRNPDMSLLFKYSRLDTYDKLTTLNLTVARIRNAGFKVSEALSLWYSPSRPAWCDTAHINNTVREFLQTVEIARGIASSIDRTCSMMYMMVPTEEEKTSIVRLEDIAKCYVGEYMKTQENIEALYDEWSRKDKEV